MRSAPIPRISVHQSQQQILKIIRKAPELHSRWYGLGAPLPVVRFVNVSAKMIGSAVQKVGLIFVRFDFLNSLMDKKVIPRSTAEW